MITSIPGLHTWIEQMDLGPVTSIEYGAGVLRIELDGASPHKARTARRWVSIIHPASLIVSHESTIDDLGFVVLNGWFQHVSTALVIPYSERREAAALTLIRDQIERQDVAGLIAQLAALEEGE